MFDFRFYKNSLPVLNFHLIVDSLSKPPSYQQVQAQLDTPTIHICPAAESISNGTSDEEGLVIITITG